MPSVVINGEISGMWRFPQWPTNNKKQTTFHYIISLQLHPFQHDYGCCDYRTFLLLDPRRGSLALLLELLVLGLLVGDSVPSGASKSGISGIRLGRRFPPPLLLLLLGVVVLEDRLGEGDTPPLGVFLLPLVVVVAGRFGEGDTPGVGRRGDGDTPAVVLPVLLLLVLLLTGRLGDGETP